MSETTIPPVPGESEPAPAAQPDPAPAPAPDSDEPAPSPESEQKEQEAKNKADRRFAELSAKLTAANRERDRMAAEADFLRRQQPQQPPGQETQEQAAMRLRAEVKAEAMAELRTETFHAQGSSQFSDWRQRCDDLVKMGADAGFAQMLVEMPEGTKVAAALAEDPAAVERIASLRTERARAVELGKYAATIEGTPGRAAAPAPHPVTNAPAPIRPVSGRASPVFNEYTATSQQLADFYMRQNLEKQQKRH